MVQQHVRHFSNAAELKEFEEQVKVALAIIKDEQGTSLMDSKQVHSIEVVKAKERSSLLNVIIKLNLSKDFRKAKALITDHL